MNDQRCLTAVAAGQVSEGCMQTLQEKVVRACCLQACRQECIWQNLILLITVCVHQHGTYAQATVHALHDQDE